jgi:hypothetical protein
MGSSRPEVSRLLTQARDLLLTESQHAASHGDWGTAKTLMELAERADRLREEVSGPAGLGGPTPKQEGTQPASISGELSASPQLPLRQGYPKYLVRDDSLIKRGLQRDRRAVYEHAVPQERYEQILDRLGQLASAFAHGKQRPFSIEQIQHGLDCPRYMTYVVVSMLLRHGLLLRARKGSYTFAAPAAFAATAAALWDQLKGADFT